MDPVYNAGTTSSSRKRAARIKQLLLSDAWWRRAAFVADVLQPVKDAIELVQADHCCQADAYVIWRNMARDLKAAADLAVHDEELAAELDTVVDSLLDRFQCGCSDMMILSALLHLKYRCVCGCCSKVQHQIVRGDNSQHCVPYQHCMHPQKPF